MLKINERPDPKILLSVLMMVFVLSFAARALATEKSEVQKRRPSHYSIIHYDDRPASNYIDAGGIAKISIMIDGDRARIYRHRGEYFIEGRDGANYSLLIVNKSGGRIKAITSVDGLDVIDGSAKAGYDRVGYIINAYASANIRGWRVSDNEVAAFRFGPVSEAYAMKMDRPSNIGVINFAFFREKEYYQEPPIYIDRSESDWNRNGPRGKFSGESAPNKSPASDERYSPSPKEKRESSQSIGTEFGESRSSLIRRVDFEERTSYPEQVLNVNYASHEDLVRRGVFNDDITIIDDGPPVYYKKPGYSQPPEDWRGK